MIYSFGRSIYTLYTYTLYVLVHTLYIQVYALYMQVYTLYIQAYTLYIYRYVHYVYTVHSLYIYRYIHYIYRYINDINMKHSEKHFCILFCFGSVALNSAWLLAWLTVRTEKSYWIKPKSDCIYIFRLIWNQILLNLLRSEYIYPFPIDLELNGIWFGSKSMSSLSANMLSLPQLTRFNPLSAVS